MGLKFSDFVAFGQEFADELVSGTSGRDVIFDLPGRSTLVFANRGDDIVLAGDDRDVIFGGVGSDYIDGGKGDDIVFGGDGSFGDFLIGGSGADLLAGGAGNDVLVAGKARAAESDARFEFTEDGSIFFAEFDSTVSVRFDAETETDIPAGFFSNDEVVVGQTDSGDLFRQVDVLQGGVDEDVFDVTHEESRAVIMDFDPTEGDRLLIADLVDLDSDIQFAETEAGSSAIVQEGDYQLVVMAANVDLDTLVATVEDAVVSSGLV